MKQDVVVLRLQLQCSFDGVQVRSALSIRTSRVHGMLQTLTNRHTYALEIFFSLIRLFYF